MELWPESACDLGAPHRLLTSLMFHPQPRSTAEPTVCYHPSSALSLPSHLSLFHQHFFSVHLSVLQLCSLERLWIISVIWYFQSCLHKHAGICWIFTRLNMWPWTTKPVLSCRGVFFAIAKNTLHGLKLYIFLLCHKRILSEDHVPWRYCQFLTVNIKTSFSISNMYCQELNLTLKTGFVVQDLIHWPKV